jgi:hypothetical protein
MPGKGDEAGRGPLHIRATLHQFIYRKERDVRLADATLWSVCRGHQEPHGIGKSEAQL